VFTSDHVGQFVESNDNFGRAKIIKYVSGTEVKATTDVPFFSTDAIASGAWTLETGYEAAWSGSRGWPRCAVFHEGRLIIGGAKSLPSTVWGSRVADYFDFDYFDYPDFLHQYLHLGRLLYTLLIPSIKIYFYSGI